MDKIVTVEKLCVQSSSRYLLRDINWEVKRGEQWVVFGLNGSGKTTLLSVIAGFKEPTAGRVTVFGEAYSQANLLKNRRRIGWVSSSFFDKYYTRESALNIVLSGLSGTLGITGAISEEDVLKAKALLAEWHFGDRIDMPFSLLSKGERQNILIARALIAEPEILVLDEPGTGLDVLAREYLLQKINTLADRRQMTIIYVTHYPEEIQPIFQHCLILREGQIAASGPTSALLSSACLSEALQAAVTVKQEADGRFNLRVLAREEEKTWSPQEISSAATM